MKILTALTLLCLVMAVVAKKPHKVTVETESKSHSTKKYSKEHQRSHHHSHKKQEELVNEAEPKAKQAPIEVPEPEIELQENLEISRKVVPEERLKDLHLQDLAYEENTKKKKKGNHGAHPADIMDKRGRESDKKLFVDHESKLPADKVIEDSFEPLSQESRAEAKRNRQENKKGKDKNKKKAYEKSKNGKKHKDNKKNKDGKKIKEKKH